MQHLDDVLSDLSVFHRVDDVESMCADRFVALARRLPVYDGAVRFAVSKATEPEPKRVATPTRALNADELAQMNRNALYGPLPAAGQHVGLFEVSKVPAAPRG